MGIVEPIVIGLGIHIGKKAIDGVWKRIQGGEAPIADQSGNLGFTASHAGRTLVSKEFTVPKYQANELVVGNLYLPDTIMDFMFGNEIPLILIVEETQRQALLFTADLEAGYEVYLPHGIYSFYVFLMDPDSDDFMDAEIYAIGFPSTIDLSDTAGINLADHEDVWNIVSDFPIEITSGGPYALDFILIDTDRVPEFPKFFFELLGSGLEAEIARQPYDLTGSWELEEEYEFGSTMADMYLVQTGNELYGLMIIQDIMGDGTELVIEETIFGMVEGTSLSLSGTGVRVIKGQSDYYELDRWAGIIENSNTIRGYSEDMAGTTGVFLMKRVLGR